MSIKYDTVETGELLKWERKGTVIEGQVVNYESKQTSKGEGHVYEVRTVDGIIPFFAPSLLHKKLKNVAIGRIVKITYTDKTKTGAGNDLKHFEVLHAPANEANFKSIGLSPMDDAVEEGEISDM